MVANDGNLAYRRRIVWALSAAFLEYAEREASSKHHAGEEAKNRARVQPSLHTLRDDCRAWAKVKGPRDQPRETLSAPDAKRRPWGTLEASLTCEC
jgi:hypothetical protein